MPADNDAPPSALPTLPLVLNADKLEVKQGCRVCGQIYTVTPLQAETIYIYTCFSCRHLDETNEK